MEADLVAPAAGLLGVVLGAALGAVATRRHWKRNQSFLAQLELAKTRALLWHPPVTYGRLTDHLEQLKVWLIVVGVDAELIGLVISTAKDCWEESKEAFDRTDEGGIPIALLRKFDRAVLEVGVELAGAGRPIWRRRRLKSLPPWPTERPVTRSRHGLSDNAEKNQRE